MLYKYLAKTIDGEERKGELEAGNEEELAAFVRKQGFILISAKKIGEKQPFFTIVSDFFFRLRGVPLEEKMIFARHLSVMISAGFPLVNSLAVLAEQTDNLVFKKTLLEVMDNIRKGNSFADSLKKYPNIFNDLFVNMIAVGETAGNLEEVLRVLADQMKKDHDIISKVKGAMIYPAVVVITMFGVGILMMVSVVPKLVQTFEEMKISLPASTKAILFISNILLNYYVYAIAGISILGYLFLKFIKTAKGKEILSQFLLNVPIFKKIVKKFNSARFSRTLSSLLKAGIPIVKALDIVSNTLTNKLYSESLVEAGIRVQKGENLSVVLANYKKIYPPMVYHMIKVGEETGTLSDVLKRLAEFYEEEVTDSMKNISGLIEPILMIFIGAIVGFFAVSMISPMYSMMGSL